jgi:hypothetical protein
MSCVDQLLEGGIVSEMAIDLLPVPGPVTVVALVKIVDDWRDPDGIEAEILDVLQIVGNAIKVAATVVVKLAARL